MRAPGGRFANRPYIAYARLIHRKQLSCIALTVLIDVAPDPQAIPGNPAELDVRLLRPCGHAASHNAQLSHHE